MIIKRKSIVHLESILSITDKSKTQNYSILVARHDFIPRTFSFFLIFFFFRRALPNDFQRIRKMLFNDNVFENK